MAFEKKGQPPTCADPDRVVTAEPASLIPAFQPVRTPCRRDVGHRSSLVQDSQLFLQSISMSGLDARLATGFEEALKALVAEGPDHLRNRMELLYV